MRRPLIVQNPSRHESVLLAIVVVAAFVPMNLGKFQKNHI